MNVGEWPTKWCQLYPDENSVKCSEFDMTRRTFNERVNRLCHAFKERGVVKGDRVAGLLANGNVFVETLFSLAKLGAIMVPLNFRLSPPELSYILDDSEPKLCLYSPEFATTVDAVRRSAPSIDSWLCETDGGLAGDAKYEDWTASCSDEEPDVDTQVGTDDPLFIMYTSGTTGKPKGAILTHGNILWHTINSVPLYKFGKDDVVLAVAPLFHIGGLGVSIIPPFYVGCPIVIQRFFIPGETLQLIEQERVAFMFGIPVMFQMMCQLPEFETTDFSSVNFFIAGGSPCSKFLIERYLEKGITFNQGYGLTEAAPGVTALRSDTALSKLGSVGKPVFHVTMKIVDAAGKELGAGEPGEVVVKGPNVMPGYWNLPEETAETLKDGWLHTGDIGYFDQDGYLFLVDRKKDMYISGGENVYPAEVEDVILRQENVDDVGVIGVMDEKWGEVGLAVVVPREGVELTEEEIIEFCEGRLAKYKIPKKVIFVEELPRTATGKILKKELRDLYGN